MAFNPITDGSPFDGFFEDHLPAFFFEKFKGNDLARIQNILSNLEIAFDNIYQKTKTFPDNNDVRSAEVKYLFQLGTLLGIEDIEDLSKYVNADGSIRVITEEQYDNAIIRQKAYIANMIGRYLLKGTIESIVRLLYSKGLDATVRDLWTDESTTLGMSGNLFEYDNDLVTKYGDAIIGSITGDVYNETQPFDILSEMSATVPSASAIGDITQFEQNYFGYQYLLDDLNNLYFKTSSTPELSGAEADTWYEFNSDILTISGGIESFKLLSDRIFIKTDTGNLEVLGYDLGDPDVESHFLIDDANILFYDFIENGTRLFLDRTTNIEVRNTVDYQKISGNVAKHIDHQDPITKVVYKETGEYLITNDNSKAYILEIISDAFELKGVSAPDVYELLVDLTNETLHELFRVEDNAFTIMKYNTSDNNLKSSNIFFDINDGMTLSTTIASSAFADMNSFYQFSDQILTISDNSFGIYHISDGTFSDYSYVTGGYDYKKIFYLDKFYVKRFSGANVDFTKILGWNTFKNDLYKSHYFDLLVEIGAIENLDLAINIADLRDFIVEILDIVKPIHTELINILTVVATVANEITTLDDTLPSGAEFDILLTGKYDGIHPWKRVNNEPFKYSVNAEGGTTWTTQTNPVTNKWASVTYGNGLFVAVGYTGTGNRVMTSPDGINWTIQSSAADNNWFDVVYGNGLFVAVAGSGTGNRVMTSPDGINWTIQSSAADNGWVSITYGNGLFVAVAGSGTGNRVMTSPNGVDWTIQSSAADNAWISVTYGNGLFVAVGYTGSGNRVMTSPDGINWTIQSSAANNTWFGVTYGNGLFVAVAISGSGNRVMTSPDGINWSIQSSAADNAWDGVTYGSGLFVAVANSGTGNRVMTSHDGINWTIQSSAADNTWQAVTYGNGLFVAVSDTSESDGIMTSIIIGGSTLLYGKKTFSIEVYNTNDNENIDSDTTNDELDDLIYNNTPLP